MLLLLFLLTFTDNGYAQRIKGLQKDDACVCQMNSSFWAFPAQQFEDVQQLVQTCEDIFQKLQTQVMQTQERLPQIQATVSNVTERLQAFKYLNSNSLYNALNLRKLDQEVEDLAKAISSIHQEKPSFQTIKLTQDVNKIRVDVKKMNNANFFNLETIKAKLHSLSNRMETCRTIPTNFLSSCSQRLMTNISSPVITKLSSFGKSYLYGSWGREAKQHSKDSYWVQPLTSGHRSGNTVRVYQTFEDFMGSKNYIDYPVASSVSASTSIQGSGTVLYGEAVFYQCYNTGVLCRYDLITKTTLRLELPDMGFNNKFPYCYYSCQDWSDIDFSVDEHGLWVIYATESNYGNLVLSRVDSDAFNVTNTWKTHLFKKSVTNAFMVCGVLYATRYVSTYQEEVFYAFDTATGQEDNTLALSLEKVAGGIASLTYNPVDRKLYTYNEAYLLAFNAFF